MIEVDIFGHVVVRLGQVKRFWFLASVVSTASLRFKKIFFRCVEVARIVRLGATLVRRGDVKSLCSRLCFQPGLRAIVVLSESIVAL